LTTIIVQPSCFMVNIEKVPVPSQESEQS